MASTTETTTYPPAASGVIRCIRCGRATLDPDRWDPEAGTGRVYCDPCFDQRGEPVTDVERHAAWLANQLLGIDDPIDTVPEVICAYCESQPAEPGYPCCDNGFCKAEWIDDTL